MLILTIFLIISALFAMILAKYFYSLKKKGAFVYFSVLAVISLAVLFNQYKFGLLEFWKVVLGILLWFKNTVLFLVAGEVHIPMFVLYILLFVGFLFGMFIMSWGMVAKNRDEKSGQIDGMKLAKKMKGGK